MAKLKRKKSKLAASLNKKEGFLPQQQISTIPDHDREEIKKQVYKLQKADELQKAAVLCGKILEQNPEDIEFLFLLGTLMGQLEDYPRASALLSKAVDLKPDFAEAYNNLGNIYNRCGKFKEACMAYQKATEAKPNYVEALFNFACILKKTFHGSAAIEIYRQVLQNDPNHTMTLTELPSLLFGYGYTKEAWDCLDRLYELTKDPAVQISRDILMPIIIPSNEAIPEIRQKYSEAMEKYANSSDFTLENPQKNINRTSFRLAYHGLNDSELMKKQAEMYVNVAPHLTYTAPHCENPGYYPKKGNLRVGFVSKFFHKHSVSRCYNRMIENLAERENFEVILISTEQLGISDEAIEDVHSAVHERIAIPNEMRRAQKMVADLKLDILIYTEIGMDQLTYCLAYARLAPIQIVLPGHPDTTGIKNLDYFFSCHVAEPEENAQDNYTEELVLFSDIPQYLERPELPEKIFTKQELGLPADKNIYSCPMKMQKMHPDFDKTMKKILERDPNGVIILFKDHGLLPDLLNERLKKVFPEEILERVIMVPWAERPEFMSHLLHADVILDTYHFGGGTTCYMVFSVGTPMVTWPGGFLAGRCTIGCYKRMGFNDLVAKDWDDYVDITVKLGTDKEYHKTIKEKILATCDVLYGREEVMEEVAEKLQEMAQQKGLLN